MENSRLCSDKSPVSPLPVQLHLIRSARRRDSAARGTGRVPLTARRVGKRGGRRGKSDGTSNGERNKNLTMFLSNKSILSYWRWRLRLSRFITTGRRVREQFFLFLFLLSGLGS